MKEAHPDYDLIVIGGGCAGLSLARRLIEDESTLRVLILEHRDAYSDDRTWCFWENSDHSLKNLEAKTWATWQFSCADDAIFSHRSDSDLAYRCIRSKSFYKHVQNHIDKSTYLSLMMSVSVNDIQENANSVSLTTDRGEFCSRWGIDTRPLHDHVVERQFGQHFLGIEIECDQEVFDDQVAQIMTNMQQDEFGFRFTYLLPFSTRHALFEETRFTRSVSEEVLETKLQASIKKKIKGVGFQECRRERGFIPMSCNTKPAQQNSRIVQVGVTAGLARPSTGYAFLRIQAWALECALALSNGSPPTRQTADAAWMRWADRLFLKVIEDSSNDVPEIFLALAKRMRPDHFVRFLSDSAQPADLLRAIYALPKRTFIAGLTGLPRLKPVAR